MIFEYRCAKCGHEQEELRTLAQRNDVREKAFSASRVSAEVDAR
jgi:hypothetical protein